MPFVAWIAGWVVRVILPWVVALASGIFVAQTDWFQDQAVWVFDQLLSLAVNVAGQVGADLPANNFSSSWAALPADFVGMASELGLPESLAAVTAALVVRFLLQAIPFVRWGS